MKIDPNAPASAYFSPECGTSHGLTIRAHFAAMAMQGMLANQLTLMAISSGENHHKAVADATDMAVVCADKLIESLNK